MQRGEEGHNRGGCGRERGRGSLHNYQIQWCEICMFMRNNIAFLLWKFCGLRSRRDRHNASYAQRRQIFFSGLATWTSHRIAVSGVCGANSAICDANSAHFQTDREGERGEEDGNMMWICQRRLNFSWCCWCSASAASVLHANCFMANWNWFNNRFNLSLSIFDTHTWAHNNNHFL